MTTKITIKEKPSLLVRCNPDHVLDANGVGVCAVPHEGTSSSVYVGASIDYEASKAERRVVFAFDREAVVKVPITAYYLRRIEAGELLPADQATEDFVFPERAIARAAKAASDADAEGSEPDVEDEPPTGVEGATLRSKAGGDAVSTETKG